MMVTEKHSVKGLHWATVRVRDKAAGTVREKVIVRELGWGVNWATARVTSMAEHLDWVAKTVMARATARAVLTGMVKETG